MNQSSDTFTTAGNVQFGNITGAYPDMALSRKPRSETLLTFQILEHCVSALPGVNQLMGKIIWYYGLIIIWIPSFLPKSKLGFDWHHSQEWITQLSFMIIPSTTNSLNSSLCRDVPRAYVQSKFYKLKVSSVPLWKRKTFSGQYASCLYIFLKALAWISDDTYSGSILSYLAKILGFILTLLNAFFVTFSVLFMRVLMNLFFFNTLAWKVLRLCILIFLCMFVLGLISLQPLWSEQYRDFVHLTVTT